MGERRRLAAILIFFFISLALIVLRLAYIQILRHDFYQKYSAEQHTRIINLAARRGDIFDRNGNIIASSIDTYSVYRHKKGWLGRKLSLVEAQKLQQADPKANSLVKEKKRIYPKSDRAAQLIGFVGLDNQGLSGVELSFDEYLRGKEGKLVTEGDPSGRELYGALRELEPGSNGLNVTLTIDENIQYVAERELAEQIKSFGANSGMCIVMDAQNGEILALASKPDFDPNDYGKANSTNWHPRFLNPYEPGSTFKGVTVAAALQEGVITTDTKLQALDQIEIGGKIIKNSHQIKWEGKQLSISRMLEQSINTATVQVGLKLGPERFYRQIRNFGFGAKVGCGLYGESKGIVRDWRDWYKSDIGMITFGQSISVTPLQLIGAYSAFATDGYLLKPILIKRVESEDGRFVKAFTNEKNQMLSPQVAADMRQLLRNVVVLGSGRRASMEAFAVCGKTGTAQKAARGIYLKGNYIASFVGFAPMKEPRIVCLVILDNPKASIWGESVAGPVFKRVVEFTLRYLNVRPDML
ncbi:penicillin-binding protein 2 [Candidatus Saganbacteria bacterium]|nr:penicillin-binding protein 2 [Candidatus Saganbacteria bacterium]